MIRTLSLCLAFTLLIATQSMAKEAKFPVSSIPPALLQNANAVVREAITDIDIVSSREIYYKQHYTVTVLNEGGVEYALVDESYDKYRSIESIEGNIYDAVGKEIGEVKESAIKDMGISTWQFFSDLRHKVFAFNYVTYPYTVSFDIEIRLNSSFDLPGWAPQYNFDCAVEKSFFSVHYPKHTGLHYKCYGIQNINIDSSDINVNTLSASVSSLNAQSSPDVFTPRKRFRFPEVILSADTLLLDEYSGQCNSWKNFGLFVYNLNAGRDSLPEPTKKLVHELTDTCASKNEKIAILYKHLQQTTRYVCIQLGIGGWQTAKSKEVAEKGYGDCKGLSNYMKALLKEAGINSCLVLVYGGDKSNNTVVTDFPHSYFNHMILCVPDKADTVWLECTSQELPAGYLSQFTANRHVLLLTPDGGVLTRTPAYDDHSNRLERCVRLDLSSNNEYTGEITTTSCGYWYDMEKGLLAEGKSKVNDYFNKRFALKSYNFENLQYNNEKEGKIPVIKETLSVSGREMFSQTGDRLFLFPKTFECPVTIAGITEVVRDSFELFHDYLISDTTVIALADRYTAEKMPVDINLDFIFASYHSKAILENGNKVKIIVTYRQKEGIYPASVFADFKKISRQISSNAAYNNIVLKKS
jgi:hypothetical protein